MKNREDAARYMVTDLFEMEDSVIEVLRVISEGEESPNEPIKLLEVTEMTVKTGIIPVYFGPSDDNPYPQVIIEITPDEYDDLKSKKITLPYNWSVGELLYKKAS
ncbi:MAG: hypothetical protein GY749_26950 [Desulfobacteraceae bacterium]|nr:hypothetical protein [Desulfobacteraceae bacterium]